MLIMPLPLSVQWSITLGSILSPNQKTNGFYFPNQLPVGIQGDSVVDRHTCINICRGKITKLHLWLCVQVHVLPTWESECVTLYVCVSAEYVLMWLREWNWLPWRCIIVISVPSSVLWRAELAGQQSVKLNKWLCFLLRRLRRAASHLLAEHLLKYE